MTSPRVTRSRARALSSQETGAGAAAAEAAVPPPPVRSAAAAAAATAAAASEAGPSRRKRPLETQGSPLSEDDYSCPICLNLLLVRGRRQRRRTAARWCRYLCRLVGQTASSVTRHA